MGKYNITIILALFGLFSLLNAQDPQTINLANPSFEDYQRAGKPPTGWIDCGKPGETPPDVQPGSFQVSHPAQQGTTYLGLVTRDNETWEGVGQRLSSPMEPGECYQFRIYLTASDEYFSPSRTNKDGEFFVKPVKLQIWGGNGYCDKRELLGESDLVTNNDWKEFQFVLKPKRAYKFIVLEAFYKTPVLFPYNGNLLVDNASALVPTGNCKYDPELMEDSEEPLIAANDNVNVKPDKPKPPKPKPEPKPDPIEPEVIVQTPVVAEPKILEDLDIAKIKEGQSIRIENLNFKADSFNIIKDMYPVLNEIYTFLDENKKVTVEIGGHTNGLPSAEHCNWLSDKRADAVTTYLVKKGVDKDRIKFKGYGKTKPIATNSTKEGRKKNQRVEIKILSLGG